MRKAILSKCDTCKLPKPGKAYRRKVDKTRHGSCIVCEDALALLKQQLKAPATVKKQAYNTARYAKLNAPTAHKRAALATTMPPVRTRWVGGSYPGAAA